jgi:hypothetical protein
MSSVETSAPVAAPRKSRWRIVEWFWRGQAMRAARQTELSARPQRQQRERAVVAARLASYALDPSDPSLSGAAGHLACALYAESIGWSLRLAAAGAADTVHATRAPDSQELSRLLVEQHAALEAVVGTDTLARISKYLSERAFEHTTSPADEVEKTAHELKLLAQRLLENQAGTAHAVDRVVAQRALRLGCLAVALASSMWLISALRERAELSSDLSVGKPWATSSTHEVICQSPAHHCGSDKGYFFHTQEEKDPWLEIDLNKVERFSAVRVLNRLDCCAERVAPLLIEASSDHRSWRQLAVNKDPFENWKASFPPAEARWVRLRIARRSHLHLFDVRVLR